MFNLYKHKVYCFFFIFLTKLLKINISLGKIRRKNILTSTYYFPTVLPKLHALRKVILFMLKCYNLIFSCLLISRCRYAYNREPKSKGNIFAANFYVICNRLTARDIDVVVIVVRSFASWEFHSVIVIRDS